MRSNPGRLAVSVMALVCAAILAACNDAPRLQFVTVAPISGEIYVSAAPVGAVRGAAHRGARPDLQAPPPTGKRAALTIQPATATCGSLQYAATTLFSDGSTKDVSSTATWSSSNKSVASVSSTGLATGIGLGTTNISATFNGVSAAGEPLAVDQLNSITLSPATVTVALGASQAFLAIGNFTFAAGGTGNLDVSSQVTWASSNTAVATIDNTGNATAVGPGFSTITATSCDGITVGKATLTVGPPVPTSLAITPSKIIISTGTTTLFTAMEMLSNGGTQPIPPGTAVTWSSSATTVATIDPNTGVAFGITGGMSSTITATETVSGLTGTATLTVQAATARFAYVANSNGGSISGYKVDVAAATPLTALTGSPFSASTPQQVILHPSGDLLYYLDFNGSLHVLDVHSADGDGSLTDPGQTPVPATATTSAAHLGVIDPLGRFLYVITDADNTIYGFKITQTTSAATNGALTAIPSVTGYTDSTLSTPTWLMTDRSGKYLYVVNDNTTTGNSISEYSIDPTTGALTQLGTPKIATGSAPLYGTTDVNGHIFVANSGDNTVSVYSIDTSSTSTAGQLKQVGSNFPVTAATVVFNVITDPAGKYLYVLDSPATAGQVFAYNLNSTSTTNVIGSPIGTPQATGVSPLDMAIDPTGALLAVDNNGSTTISLFNVAPTGSTTPPPGGLTQANPPTVAAGAAPQYLVFYTAASGQ